ncbi:MAG: hypothetical protein AAF602_16275 [Myxococcota bacterium]
MTTRRSFLGALVAGLAIMTLDAEAAPRHRARRRTRRRVRRRFRRRHRRRVRRRVVAGRSLLVVPVGLAVGWELVVDDRVWVVTSIQSTDGQETAVMKASDGSTTSEPILREDTADNGVELEGSELPESDTTTPGVEV